MRPFRRKSCACRCRSRRTSRSTTASPFKSLQTERVPLVTARFDIRGAGPLNDPPDHPGLAFMTAIMLRNGTADRSSRDIAEQLDLLGVSTSAGTSGDPASIFFMVTGLSETFSQWFPLAVEFLTKPSFPGDELTVAKRSFASQMAARRASPNAAASDLMVSVMIGSEAPIVPAPQTLLRLSADRLASWHRERYVPQNAVLSIVGDVDRDEAEQSFAHSSSGWARTSFADPTPRRFACQPRASFTCWIAPVRCRRR